jgi:phosphatidylserine/phosphatidylglycerophosphate/cardiolipin synthase-like enzyme
MKQAFREKKFQSIRKIVSLKSTLSTLLFLFVYTLITYLPYQKSPVCFDEKADSITFLSTDLKDPVRESIIQAIKDAKSSICLIIYALSDQKILSALREAAKRGVYTQVIYDPVATEEGDFLLGKDIHSYPRRERGLMHHKLLVIDHMKVFFGSQNFTPTSLESHGNLVAMISSLSLAERIEKLAQAMIDKKPFRDPPLILKTKDETIEVYFNPTNGNVALKKLVDIISSAKSRIFIAMFTFTNPEITRAVISSFHRGVDVRVLFDQQSSLQTSKKAFLAFKREKIPHGTRTKSGLLHYKMALIDDCFVFGSTNFTKAGFFSNNDLIAFMYPLTSKQEKILLSLWKTLEKNSSINP